MSPALINSLKSESNEKAVKRDAVEKNILHGIAYLLMRVAVYENKDNNIFSFKYYFHRLICLNING